MVPCCSQESKRDHHLPPIDVEVANEEANIHMKEKEQRESQKKKKGKRSTRWREHIWQPGHSSCSLLGKPISCCTRAQDCQWHPMTVKISFGLLEMFSLKVFLEESSIKCFFMKHYKCFFKFFESVFLILLKIFFFFFKNTFYVKNVL